MASLKTFTMTLSTGDNSVFLLKPKGNRFVMYESFIVYIQISVSVAMHVL